MDYPYDTPALSPFTKAYLELLRKHPLLDQPIPELLEALDDDLAPEAAAVLHTLAHHSFPYTYLVWRSLYYRGDDTESFPAVEDWESYNVGEDAPNRFDTDRAMLLGESAGGEVYFGLHWGGGELRFFEVDLEDELGEPIREFATADDFWQHIRDSEYDWAESEGEEAPPEFLVELYEAAGAALSWSL